MLFDEAWTELVPAARRSLELAYESLIAGGLPVGSVLTDLPGDIVAEGRNRAYDPPGGADVLQGTPLAHAEMNVLAAVRTDWDLSGCTLWSTHQPCSMCAAAAAFTSVGTVRYVAPDPWAVAAGATAEASGSPLGDPRWARVAGVLFVLGVANRVGPEPRSGRDRAAAPARSHRRNPARSRPSTVASDLDHLTARAARHRAESG